MGSYKSVNGTKLFYRVVGEGKPCVVIHGGPGLSHDYLVPYLQPFCSLIFYDQRSSGRSEATLEGLDLATFVRDLEALRIALGHEKIAILGHSWGTILAVAYAMEFPDTVDQLMLISSIPLASEEYPALLQERALRLAPHMSEVKMIQSSSKYSVKDPELMHRYDRLILGTFCAEHKSIYNIDFRRSPEARANGEKVLEAFKYGFFAKPFNLYENLSKICCKTWILHGTEDPHPLTAAEKIHALIHGSHLCILENCGHFPFAERPSAFNAQLKSSLE